MPFEMPKLTSFLLEKLCYDLKLEVLEQMEPNDAFELVKVKAGFRSILLRAPWIVFGYHVHKIYRDRSKEGTKIGIEKFPGSSSVHLDAIHHPLIKRIQSCDELSMFLFSEQFINEHATILNQLNSVKHLRFSVCDNELLLKFFENFRSMIEESAYTQNWEFHLFIEDQVLSERFKNFIANQVNDCEQVGFRCRSADSLHFYYDDFAKSSIKFLKIFGTSQGLEEVVQLIVKKRIPSKNLKAAFYADAFYSQQVNARIVDFLSQFPGMSRFDGENEQKVMKMATEFLEKHIEDFSVVTKTESLILRRNIDSSRDCVYTLFRNSNQSLFTHFFAFYVQPQTEMIEF